LALSAALVAATVVLAVIFVRSVPRAEAALFAAGVIVLAGLLPARSFQNSYQPLLVLLLGPIWRCPIQWRRGLRLADASNDVP
jgi:hypothetical protein